MVGIVGTLNSGTSGAVENLNIHMVLGLLLLNVDNETE